MAQWAGAHRATSSTSILPCSLHRWRWQIRAMWWQDGDGRSERSQRAPGNPTLQRPWPQAALAGVRQAAHLCSRQTPALHAMVHLTLARWPPASGARAGAGQCARMVVARAVVALGRAFMQLSGRSGRLVGHRSAGRGRSTSKDEEAIDSPLAPRPKTLYEGLVSFQAYLVCYALGARNLTRIVNHQVLEMLLSVVWVSVTRPDDARAAQARWPPFCF